jgi:drug/metabolite transporter, DME family
VAILNTDAMASSTTSPSTAHPWRGLMSVSLAGVIWGTIGPGVQLINELSGLSPWTISAYRAVAAVAVLLIVSLVMGRLSTSWSLARRHWRRVTVVGVLTAAFQLQFFVAVIETGVSVATVVALGSPPVVLLVLTSIRHRRPASSGRTVTVAVAVVGLVLVSLGNDSGDHLRNPRLGILAALGSGVAYALSADVAAPLSRRLDTLTVTTATMTVAAATLTPGGLVLAYLRHEPLTTTDTGSWLLIGYLGAVTMAVAYALLFMGLRSTPSGAAVVATLLEPVTAVLIAVTFLGDHLTGTRLLGSLLILTAIATMGLERQQPPPQ